MLAYQLGQAKAAAALGVAPATPQHIFITGVPASEKTSQIRDATEEDFKQFSIRDIDLHTSQYGTPHQVKLDVTSEKKFRGLIAAEPGTGRLTGLYVSPQHRRQDVATQLMESLPTPATFLRRVPKNLRAKKFYESLGFQDTGLIDDPHVGKVMVMERTAEAVVSTPIKHTYTTGAPQHLVAFKERLTKKTATAGQTLALPTITPATKNRWTLAIQRHETTRTPKRPHLDLRLVDPDAGKAHSWALPKARLPEPGEKLLAVQTFTHTPDYALHFGEKKPETIGKGYGKGRVQLIRKEPTEIVESNNDLVRFHGTKGDGQKYVLRRTHGDKWLLQNVTKRQD